MPFNGIFSDCPADENEIHSTLRGIKRLKNDVFLRISKNQAAKITKPFKTTRYQIIKDLNPKGRKPSIHMKDLP
jgi:hypothetical protein